MFQNQRDKWIKNPTWASAKHEVEPKCLTLLSISVTHFRHSLYLCLCFCNIHHYLFLGKAKLEIFSVLEDAFEKQLITRGEFQAMNPEECDPARFYCNFKVHKDHLPGETPAVRPIISGLGSTAENIGKFVEYHISEIAKSHNSFLEDTPDFF